MKFTASVLLRAITLFILLECMGRVERAAGVSIDLFSTPDCSSCNLTIHQGEQRSFFVCAPIADAFPEYLQGGEFRIIGVPTNWTIVSVTPGPGLVVILGNPLGSGVFFSTPAGVTGLCAQLFVIELLATTEEEDLRFRVEAAEEPSNQDADCPLLRFGPQPGDLQICANGGTLLVNSALDCSVGVVAAPWGGIKQLYRR